VSMILLVLLAACGEKTGPTVSSDAAVVVPNVLHVQSDALQELVIQSVTLIRLAESLTLAGHIQYSLDGFARIGTPLVGVVKTVQRRLGEKVVAGQVLATIESAELGTAYADFAKAESDVQFTHRNVALSKELYAIQALAKKDFDQAQNDDSKAQTELNRARQRLVTLRVSPTELEKPALERRISTHFDLKSPLTGVVVEKNVTVGQVVGQDQAQTLFTVADLNVLQMVADVYERDLRFLHAGMTGHVTVESFPTQAFPAQVVHVGEVVDLATRTIQIRCDVTNIEHRLKPDMFARIHVVLASAPTAVVLPRTAVVRMGPDTVVFVQRSDTSFERRPVVTGSVAGDTIEIRNGLQDGEHVVVKGAVLLKGALEKALEQVHIQSL
jgi:cobalt-zinc-cadmium efflux system membrane fusion protein